MLVGTSTASPVSSSWTDLLRLMRWSQRLGTSRNFCLPSGTTPGALRFGDQRAMALVGSLCLGVHAVTGFANKSLRGLVAGLLGSDYTASPMSYDLRRLRLHGLISRVLGSNTYVVTPEGTRVAVFCTKPHDRLLAPLLDADRPPHPSSYVAPSHRRVHRGRLHRPRSSRDSRLKLVTRSRDWNTKKC